MIDTLEPVAATKEGVDQEQLAQRLLRRPRNKELSWSARTGC
jgi:hypothetical protein